MASRNVPLAWSILLRSIRIFPNSFRSSGIPPFRVESMKLYFLSKSIICSSIVCVLLSYDVFMTFITSAHRVEIVFPLYLACNSKYASLPILANPITSTASLSQFHFIVKMAKLLSLLHCLTFASADFFFASESGSFTSPVTISHIVSCSCS